jgi:hypothetical protein
MFNRRRFAETRLDRDIEGKEITQESANRFANCPLGRLANAKAAKGELDKDISYYDAPINYQGGVK